MHVVWKRILLWSSAVLVASLVILYIVLVTKYDKKAIRDIDLRRFMRPYTCVKTCLSQEEELHAQKIINNCKENECDAIRSLLSENNCDEIKNWYILNKEKVLP